MDHGCRPVINKISLSELDVGVVAGDIICAVSDIDDGAAKEISYRTDNEVHDIFIQRIGEDIFGFMNVCPHAGTPLNMEEGQFMEKSGKYLMCHTHGALFQLSDGLCVAGPCNGSRLQAVDITIKNGNVIVV